MRLVTVITPDGREPGVLADDARAVLWRRADASLPATVRGALGAGEPALGRIRSLAGAAPAEAIVALDGQHRLGAPIDDASKILAIGLNYRKHAEELGAQLPERPIVFAKFPNTVVGPGDAVEVPAASTKVDWEGELCVVIGRRARNVKAADGLSYVAGYMASNDVSVRD